MIQSLFLDTSIWNFALADDSPDFRDLTLELFDLIHQFESRAVISNLVVQEIDLAPLLKASRMHDLIASINPYVFEMTDEAFELGRAYITHGVLSENHSVDCFHVAAATILDVEFLLSWNFRHLANENKSSRFSEVNGKLGYPNRLKIGSPLEVLRS
ncbi:MAG: hypothetical protein KC931_07070 [Candidatus Omnitrophica bacterium]|nr:hypothetical protein [Candidatus Omnitrophota bacterium]MCB9768941.1 hypothetical protein [Candidatus Omnitrophota bacterium]MCB9782461.1 hypothetical protein [Candidatus Omnitrophota bacterium]